VKCELPVSGSCDRGGATWGLFAMILQRPQRHSDFRDDVGRHIPRFRTINLETRIRVVGAMENLRESLLFAL
jgi:hypothetical protein